MLIFHIVKILFWFFTFYLNDNIHFKFHIPKQNIFLNILILKNQNVDE